MGLRLKKVTSGYVRSEGMIGGKLYVGTCDGHVYVRDKSRLLDLTDGMGRKVSLAGGYFRPLQPGEDMEVV